MVFYENVEAPRTPLTGAFRSKASYTKDGEIEISKKYLSLTSKSASNKVREALKNVPDPPKLLHGSEYCLLISFYYVFRSGIVLIS